MKTEFLKKLGIEDQIIIDSIMAENGRDIENAKKDYASVSNKVKELSNTLAEKENELTTLKETVGSTEELTAKVLELEHNNSVMKDEYETRLAVLMKENEIETKLRNAKAKNIKAARALLNDEEDIDEQIKVLQESSESNFLFDLEEVTDNTPTGTTPSSGKDVKEIKYEMSFADAISKALKH